MDNSKLAYRIDEAVKATGIGRTTLYQAIASGQLCARKLGHRTVILHVDLERFLDNLKQA